jgi:hypothetical protein
MVPEFIWPKIFVQGNQRIGYKEKFEHRFMDVSAQEQQPQSRMRQTQQQLPQICRGDVEQQQKI